jgi:hypothetical protein
MGGIRQDKPVAKTKAVAHKAMATLLLTVFVLVGEAH